MKDPTAIHINALREGSGASDQIRYSRVGWMGSTKSVILDGARKTITFENCFVPRRWFAGRLSHFQCSLDDIVVVYAYRDRRGQMLKIVTVSGTVEILERSSTGFVELSAALSSFSEPNGPEYPLENPALGALLGLVYVGGAIAGMAAGLFLVPRVAGARTVAFAMMCGGFCGLLASKLGIDFAYRWWQVELIKPLGFGCLGAGLALFVGVKIGPNVAWDWRVTFLPVPVAFVGGVVLGMMLNRRRGVRGK